ncbi:MAG: YicC/YloC family endoribonuclease [Bacteroidia bacterium]|nr:YicC/YloC family endoribonuclease [Bacteroidia bacterium]
MTGYGKAECVLPDGKMTIEIRSLNGKNADISIKSSLIPREKEMEVRQYIAKELQRGNIDLFASVEQNAADKAKQINKDIFAGYLAQIKDLGMECSTDALMQTILKLPDVIEVKKQEITEQTWEAIKQAIYDAVGELNGFRSKEGEILYADVTGRVALIESFVKEVETYEQSRTTAVKERIKARIDELGIAVDQNRLEQEIVFYVEKLDINEEKVRLRQHCKYFIETINSEPYPGKKLGFIAQEMGREINTMGSKANHAEIQKWVVRMKDELEKIKEQSLNIL